MAKPRAFLVHWNAQEAAVLEHKLRRYDWEVVETETQSVAHAVERIAATRPDAVVIYLSREPTHGEEVALGVRQLKATAGVPVIFVGGKAKAVARARERVPNVTFATDATLDQELLKLLREEPAVFGTRA